MSNSVWPHRRQPTRLPHSWDSPGKNTGVGCHFLLQCMKVESESEVGQSCPTLSDPMDCSLPGSSTHGIFQARVLEWGAIAFSKHWVLVQLKLWPRQKTFINKGSRIRKQHDKSRHDGIFIWKFLQDRIQWPHKNLYLTLCCQHWAQSHMLLRKNLY